MMTPRLSTLALLQPYKSLETGLPLAVGDHRIKQATKARSSKEKRGREGMLSSSA